MAGAGASTATARIAGRAKCMTRSLPRKIVRENSAILRVVARHDHGRTTVPSKLAGETPARGASAVPASTDGKDAKDSKKKIRWSEAWHEASVLVWARRGRLAI